MNGEYAPNDDALDDDENLELHMVDYSIGYNVIYAVFSWSVADEAYELMRSLAQKHKVGFFDVSGDDGDIILPDGIMIKQYDTYLFPFSLTGKIAKPAEPVNGQDERRISCAAVDSPARLC